MRALSAVAARATSSTEAARRTSEGCRLSVANSRVVCRGPLVSYAGRRPKEQITHLASVLRRKVGRLARLNRAVRLVEDTAEIETLLRDDLFGDSLDVLIRKGLGEAGQDKRSARIQA